jgi:hypothetical protein
MQSVLSYLRCGAILALSMTLLGCHSPSPDASGGHGRYVGVGIYGPGKQWTRMAAVQESKEAAAARPIDDQAIIVVSDTQTGELRACGDLTGYCIGFNPWKERLGPGQQTPIALTGHVKPDDPNMTVEVGPAPRHKKQQSSAAAAS